MNLIRPVKIFELQREFVKLEEQAGLIKARAQENICARADVLFQMFSGDWKAAGYTTIRHFCEQTLNVSYEYCSNIQRAAKAIRSAIEREKPLPDGISVSAANELGRLPAELQETVIDRLEAMDRTVTRDSIRRAAVEYNAALAENADKVIESQIRLLAERHSQPEKLLTVIGRICDARNSGEGRGRGNSEDNNV